MKPTRLPAVAATVAALALSMPGLAYAAPSATPTATPSATATPSSRASSSATPTPRPSASASATPTASPTPERTPATVRATPAIAEKYAANPWLGAPQGGEFDLPGGKAQAYAVGTIYWTPNTGAQIVQGLVRGRYQEIGAQNSPLGLPISDEFAGGNGTRVNRFEHGLLIWSPSTGAWEVHGVIEHAYAANGFEAGPVGPPTGPQFVAKTGATVQRFANGLAVQSGGSAYIVRGLILGRYADYGWEGGVLGSPTTNEFQGADARVQNFDRGQIIWSPKTGAHPVYGEIAKTYARMGFEGGQLGRPTSDEFTGARGARVQRFERGLIIWSPGTGAQPVYGAILDKYSRLGWEGGALGLPKTFEFDGANGSRVQNFDNGQIIFTPRTGANSVQGRIAEEYGALGWEGGALGVPTSDEFAGAKDARVNRFANGLMVWTPRTGAFAVRGAILGGYGFWGYEGGQLGAPTSNEFAVNNGIAQDFEHGRLLFTNGRVETVWPGPSVDARCRTGRVMCISKSDRKLRWMIDGVVLKEMDARFGAAGSPTREGQFTVFSKVRDEISYMYGNTPMPFAMYFSGGEAVHYSYDFAAYGYSKTAFASHGCVNIRDWDGIQWLYDTQVRTGDKVVVYW